MAYRRAANIVGIEEKKDTVKYGGMPDPSRFERSEESHLATRLEDASARVETALSREAFDEAMSALAGLRGPIDEFFTKITVNVDDRIVRANRLHLLARIRDIFDRVADFSKIEG